MKIVLLHSIILVLLVSNSLLLAEDSLQLREKLLQIRERSRRNLNEANINLEKGHDQKTQAEALIARARQASDQERNKSKFHAATGYYP
jgi:hypothetical protein